MISPNQVIRSDFLNSILRALKERSGVISGLEVVATSPPSMNVVVRAGRALINESIVTLASDTTIAISTPGSTYDRLDLITLKSDGSIGYYVGTASAKVALDPNDPRTFIKPSPPATPVGEIPLAEVYVPAGATSISTFIDRRIFWQTVMTVEALKSVNEITFSPLSADPSLAAGKIWFRGDLNKIRFSRDGSTIVNVLKEDDPLNISQISGTPLTGRDWSLDIARLQNLDVALTVLANLQRWGRNVSPAWVHAAEVTAPDANTALVSKTVSTGKTGYIYGFYISAGEANDFKINWTSDATAYSVRIVFSGRGSLQYIDFTPINEGLPADAETSITITNVNAGSAGIAYQARLLYAEI